MPASCRMLYCCMRCVFLHEHLCKSSLVLSWHLLLTEPKRSNLHTMPAGRILALPGGVVLSGPSAQNSAMTCRAHTCINSTTLGQVHCKGRLYASWIANFTNAVRRALAQSHKGARQKSPAGTPNANNCSSITACLSMHCIGNGSRGEARSCDLHKLSESCNLAAISHAPY